MKTTLPPRLQRGKTGKIILTDRDRLIIRAVYQFRFLTTDHIQILTGSKSRTKLNERLKRLFDAKYLDRPPVQDRIFAYADKRPLVHALGDEGAKYIKDALGACLPRSVSWRDKNQKVKSADFLLHTLGIADFFISLQSVLVQQPLVRLLDEDMVLAQAPARTHRLEFPLSLSTEYRWFDDQHVTRSTIPDGIFAIVDKRGEQDRTAFHFLEYDGNTMPVVRRTPNQSSIVQKMFGYAAIRDQKLHKDRFGYKNFRVLFVTKGKDRIESMIEAYDTHARDRIPPGAFLFADYDDLIAHSPLGSIWVNGKNEPVELVPGLSLNNRSVHKVRR